MPDSKETTGRKGDHQNVARAAQVIDIIAASGPNGLRMTDVTERSGLGGSTVHRLLAGLIEHGLIDQDPETNRYLVGLKMVSWTAAALSRYGLAPYADASLERLCAATSDTVYLSYRSGNDAVCVDRREGNFPIKNLNRKNLSRIRKIWALQNHRSSRFTGIIGGRKLFLNCVIFPSGLMSTPNRPAAVKSW